MATEFKLSVVAPDRTVVEEPVTSIVAPAIDGYIGIMAGHSPMIAALRPGLVEITLAGGSQESIAVGGGFMEVSPTSVIILADDAEFAREVDVKKEEEALERARKALRGEDSTMTTDEATHVIERASARLRAAKNR